MADLRTLVKEAYFSLDRRVLGCFRLGYGAALLYDLIRRACQLELLYSNDGVLANHFLLFAPQVPGQFSLYFAFSTPGEVALAFALTGLIYSAYALGLFTRWAQILALLCLTSLNQRSLFFEDGGMSTMIALAVWTVFLPLGDRYSLDALRRDARTVSIRERVLERARLTAPVTSLAVLAIVLQIVAIYTLNVVHKNGDTWRGGTAVHYVLWQNRVNTIIGNWLAFHEPSWFSPLATRMTLISEASIPALVVLLPHKRVFARTVAFLLAIGLHGGIALVMTLGPFSYAMLCLVGLMVPAETLSAVFRYAPRRLVLKTYRARARLVRLLGPFMRRAPAPAQPSSARLAFDDFRNVLRESVVALLIVISVIEVAADNRAIRRFINAGQPPPFAMLVGALRMIQSWNMFAPDAPKDDGMVVIDARTESGGHIDPFTGKPPDFEIGLAEPVPHSVMLCDYLFSMRLGNEAYRGQLTDYLKRWHTLKHRPDADRIVSYEFYWINHLSPSVGSTQPTNLTKELIFSGP